MKGTLHKKNNEFTPYFCHLRYSTLHTDVGDIHGVFSNLGLMSVLALAIVFVNSVDSGLRFKNKRFSISIARGG
jgi:hypothetical protein